MEDKRVRIGGRILRLFWLGVGTVVLVSVAWTVIKQRYDSRLIREIRGLGGRAATDHVMSVIWTREAGDAPSISFTQRIRESASDWFRTRDKAVCDVNLNGCQLG